MSFFGEQRNRANTESESILTGLKMRSQMFGQVNEARMRKASEIVEEDENLDDMLDGISQSFSNNIFIKNPDV